MNGDQSNRSMLNPQQHGGFGAQEEERPALNWAKLIGLVLMTFGLIVGLYALCLAMEKMKGGLLRNSFEDAGGLLFGLFCFYVLCFGVKWYCGASQRQVLKREAVEKQIAREKANQALFNLE